MLNRPIRARVLLCFLNVLRQCVRDRSCVYVRATLQQIAGWVFYYTVPQLIIRIMKSPAYLLLICMCLAKSSADLSSGHSSFSPLDEDQKMKLYWNIDMASKEIYFTVEAQTTGWVGFGISSGQGKMAGADIVIGWVKDGKPYFKVKQRVQSFELA